MLRTSRNSWEPLSLTIYLPPSLPCTGGLHVGRRETPADGHGTERLIGDPLPHQAAVGRVSDAIRPLHYGSRSIILQTAARRARYGGAILC